MSSLQLLRDGIELARERGIRDTYQKGKAFTREAALRKWHDVNGLADRGDPIYEQDWNLLIVLDACRADMLREVAEDHEFLSDFDVSESVGSYSLSWMERNFTEEYADEMAETVMVTGNPFSESALDDNKFSHLEEVWKYSWDEDIGTIRPRALTDEAISLSRDLNPEQMIVHYMQPHAPFTTHPELQQGPSATDWANATDKSIWMRTQEGDISLERTKNAYMDELQMVLEDVSLLLDNVDAEVAVISADHGEAMGESGIYGHARGVAIDELRVVPWVETTATDSREYIPDNQTSTEEGDQMDRLRDLGYLE